MRKALVVGIDYYESISSLNGCVNDAHSVKSVLERNADGTVNFSVKLQTGTGPQSAVTRAHLRESVRELFSGDSEIALFYFAGHGFIESFGGFLCTSDNAAGDDGIPLTEIMTIANQSKAKNKIILLDSCHSGMAGTNPTTQNYAEIAEGITILTASTAEQYALEENGQGIFTSLMVDALSGAAANLVGDVTPGSVYAHIDQSLGPWEQRPAFKTNVKSFVSLRKVQPPILLSDLQKISKLFPHPGYEFALDPDYEPKSPTPDPQKTQVFGVLQKYNRVNLVVPIDEAHMYDAAMESKGCKLTVLGEHYRRLVETGRI